MGNADAGGSSTHDRQERQCTVVVSGWNHHRLFPATRWDLSDFFERRRGPETGSHRRCYRGARQFCSGLLIRRAMDLFGGRNESSRHVRSARRGRSGLADRQGLASRLGRRVGGDRIQQQRRREKQLAVDLAVFAAGRQGIGSAARSDGGARPGLAAVGFARRQTDRVHRHGHDLQPGNRAVRCRSRTGDGFPASAHGRQSDHLLHAFFAGWPVGCFSEYPRWWDAHLAVGYRCGADPTYFRSALRGYEPSMVAGWKIHRFLPRANYSTIEPVADGRRWWEPPPDCGDRAEYRPVGSRWFGSRLSGQGPPISRIRRGER